MSDCMRGYKRSGARSKRKSKVEDKGANDKEDEGNGKQVKVGGSHRRGPWAIMRIGIMREDARHEPNARRGRSLHRAK